MAVRTGIPFYEELNISSERNCAFYARYINWSNGWSKVEATSVGVLQFLSSLNEEAREKQVFDLIRNRNATLLPDEDFKWLEEMERACNLIWLILRSATDEEIIGRCRIYFDDAFPENMSEFNYFNSMIGMKGFSRREEYLKEIKYFFDNFSIKFDSKKKLMGSLREDFYEACDESFKVSWLKRKDKEQCEWAWGYVKKWLYGCECFRATSHEDTYFFVIAVLDYWIGEPAEKELFLMRFKKTWDQKVYRKKQENRSPLNTYISKSSKNMLDYLAMERDEKIYQTLEAIIRKAYEERV